MNQIEPDLLRGRRPGRALGLAVAALLSAMAAGARGGDDFPDVVVTDLDSLWVFRGDGEGGFQTPLQYYMNEALEPCSVNCVEPWAVAIGDLTGDGRADIISANRYGPHAAVLVNRGGGEFDPAWFIEAPPNSQPYDVDLGDLDRDGDLDIVITCDYNPGEVIVLYNDGQGGFDERESIFAGGQTFNSVLVDLDGKDGLDLVITRNLAKDIAIYLNLGDGSFKFLKAVAAGNDPKAIRACDLNGDGFADVVVANDSAKVITIFLGDGAGGLTLERTYFAGVQPRELVLLDLDGDGVQDMVVAGGRGSTYVDRFLGNNDGSFRGPVNYATGPRPNSIDSADFDLDGNPDVAVANWSLDNESQASLSILFGDGLGDFYKKEDFRPPTGIFRKITALATGQLDQVRFKRGDPTGENHINITDPILMLRSFYLGGGLTCPDAADVDDNGHLEITDVVRILGWLYMRGETPPAPFAAPGFDPTPDHLGCDW